MKKIFRRSTLSDLLNNLDSYPLYLIPFVALVIGILGSFHCVGMCGGLILMTTKTKKDKAMYHSGRLIGYTILWVVFTFFGIGLSKISENLSLLTALMMGVWFIYQGFKGEKVKLKFPNRFTSFFENKFLRNRTNSAFTVGFFSMFLPCGLLYALILSVSIIGNATISYLSLLTFFIGTTPLLLLTPTLFKKIFEPLKLRSPELLNMGLIIIGVGTITYRIYLIYMKSCMLCH